MVAKLSETKFKQTKIRRCVFYIQWSFSKSKENLKINFKAIKSKIYSTSLLKEFPKNGDPLNPYLLAFSPIKK